MDGVQIPIVIAILYSAAISGFLNFNKHTVITAQGRKVRVNVPVQINFIKILIEFSFWIAAITTQLVIYPGVSSALRTEISNPAVHQALTMLVALVIGSTVDGGVRMFTPLVVDWFMNRARYSIAMTVSWAMLSVFTVACAIGSMVFSFLGPTIVAPMIQTEKIDLVDKKAQANDVYNSQVAQLDRDIRSKKALMGSELQKVIDSDKLSYGRYKREIETPQRYYERDYVRWYRDALSRTDYAKYEKQVKDLEDAKSNLLLNYKADEDEVLSTSRDFNEDQDKLQDLIQNFSRKFLRVIGPGATLIEVFCILILCLLGYSNAKPIPVQTGRGLFIEAGDVHTQTRVRVDDEVSNETILEEVLHEVRWNEANKKSGNKYGSWEVKYEGGDGKWYWKDKKWIRDQITSYERRMRSYQDEGKNTARVRERLAELSAYYQTILDKEQEQNK